MAIWQYDTLTARGHDAYKWNMNWGSRDGEMFTSRVNSYHKPQISISDYWQINETTRMQNSVYVSVGMGYGTGQSGLSRGGLLPGRNLGRLLADLKRGLEGERRPPISIWLAGRRPAGQRL
jgi:hypothetical protein